MMKMAQEKFAVSFINETRAKDPGMGGKKLWRMYKRRFAGECLMGRDRFEKVVDKYGLKVRKRVRKPRTTDSTHGLPTYPNLIKEFIPNAPNQLWVSDITYITIWVTPEHYKFCYLSLILDAYTEEIVGWNIGPKLDTIYPLKALEDAFVRLKANKNNDVQLIHHSDRGTQYASHLYVNLLQQYNVRISMTESGNPKDNPQAERINNTMKNELLKDKTFHSLGEAVEAVSLAISFYNEERIHMSINWMTPAEAALHTGEIRKHWKSYREQHIKEKAENASILDIKR